MASINKQAVFSAIRGLILAHTPSTAANDLSIRFGGFDWVLNQRQRGTGWVTVRDAVGAVVACDHPVHSAFDAEGDWLKQLNRYRYQTLAATA